MNEMKEIVTVEQVNGLFLALAVGAPILGAALGAAAGSRRRQARQLALRGLLIGLLGPLNLILWNVYNGITDRLGLDSVRNLLVNLALFLALGVVGGLIVSRFAGREGGEPPAGDPPVESRCEGAEESSLPVPER